ncbi:MAG: hypothetical protein VXZ64_03335, partial [Candidatus Thermoplasmatota archaeon]|nr:hypothetical protein [Candidatus Thermoplasmatota archaeon]
MTSTASTSAERNSWTTSSPHDAENRDIFINTDKGRILRPLLILHDGAPRLTPGHLEELRSGETTFGNLLTKGIIEWVDAEEEEDLFIASRPFLLPEKVPEGSEHAGRPVTSENVNWTNMGQVNASSAVLEAKVRLPNGEWGTSTF